MSSSILAFIAHQLCNWSLRRYPEHRQHAIVMMTLSCDEHEGRSASISLMLPHGHVSIDQSRLVITLCWHSSPVSIKFPSWKAYLGACPLQPVHLKLDATSSRLLAMGHDTDIADKPGQRQQFSGDTPASRMERELAYSQQLIDSLQQSNEVRACKPRSRSAA